MLEVKNLTKTFDGFKALEDLSLTVPRGAVYGLVGPNGAGKSTVIRHIMGVYRPDSGTVTLDGAPVYENPALKNTMVCIPDEIFYEAADTIMDLKRLYAGIYPKFDESRFCNLSKVFQLDVKKPIRRFSKGMQKQAAFWLAISCCPEVLVLDEPVDGLDPVMRRQIMSIILEDVAEHGTTVLVSSHNLRELEDVCDHVGIMDRGKVLLERSLVQLQDNMVKLQVVFGEGVEEVPAELGALHTSRIGRVHTVIMRANAEEATAKLAPYAPLLVDAIPLTLEEIFIYELGGVDYAVKEIVL